MINISRDSYIPEDYISSSAQRIDIYKKIAAIENQADADDVADELLDRYGEYPNSVEALIAISLIRSLASECGFVQIDHNRDDVMIYPSVLDIPTWSEIAAQYPGRVIIKPADRPRVVCKRKHSEPIFGFINDLLKKYIQIKFKKL